MSISKKSAGSEGTPQKVAGLLDRDASILDFNVRVLDWKFLS
jgi:hypothetical protein